MHAPISISQSFKKSTNNQVILKITTNWQLQEGRRDTFFMILYAKTFLGDTTVVYERSGPPPLPYICAYWVCAIFETPIFNPKFPLQSISFSQITENPLQSITILEFLPLRRPSFSFLYFQVVPRHRLRQRPGATAGQNAARRSPTISSRDHQFHTQTRARDPHFKLTLEPAWARSRDHHFHARAAPEPHIFHFAVAHTYQNVGRVPPPPPGSGLIYHTS